MGVTILSVLILLAALIVTLIGLAGLVVGLASMLPGIALPTGNLLLGGLLYLVLGAILFVAGGALMALKRWAWFLAFIAALAALAYSGYGAYAGLTTSGAAFPIGSVVATVILGIIVVYLLTVYAFFRRPVVPVM